ncbi:MAG: hypothetical protein ABI672_13610 [Vicinamibacteria bacterium]
MPRDRKSALLAVGTELFREQQETQARQLAREKAQKIHLGLARDAFKQMEERILRLFKEIAHDVPTALLPGESRELLLGKGSLYWHPAFTLTLDESQASSRRLVCCAVFGVTQDDSEYPGQSANLWFADWHNVGSYRWWEVEYRSAADVAGGADPFGVSSKKSLQAVEWAHAAKKNGLTVGRIPSPVDGGDEGAFIQRWEERLALAAQAKLVRPN